jgi:hypothetical protein
MSDNAELIARLRREGEYAFAKHYSLGMWKLCAEAADALAALQADRDYYQRMAAEVSWDYGAAEARIAELEGAQASALVWIDKASDAVKHGEEAAVIGGLFAQARAALAKGGE